MQSCNLDIFSLETLISLSVVHCSMGRLVDRLHLALDNQEKRLVDKDIREEITMEWKHCALVIDRFDTLNNYLLPYKIVTTPT